MSDETAPLVVTLKAGTGYDAPWIVVRGDTPVDVVAKLNGLGEVISATVEAANLFKGAGNAAPIVQNAPQAAAPAQPASPPGWAQPQQQAAPPQQSAVVLHPQGITCPSCNAPVQYKSVFSKAKNKNFNFWTCPNQRSRDDSHYSEFAD